jgi:hypothetical protein
MFTACLTDLLSLIAWLDYLFRVLFVANDFRTVRFVSSDSKHCGDKLKLVTIDSWRCFVSCEIPSLHLSLPKNSFD